MEEDFGSDDSLMASPSAADVPPAGWQAALQGLELAIYAITSLCPEEDDGSHRPIISKQTLAQLRTYRARALPPPPKA